MQKRHFILCDQDASYVNRFMNYSQKRANFPFQVLGFTKEEGVEQLLEDESVDAALVSWLQWQSWTESLRELVKSHVECLILLTEDRRSGQMGIPTLYKYQSMDTVLREVLAIYEKNSKEREAERKIEILGFYSPIGHCGKTTAALHLGQMMAEREGLEILYVNMEALGTWAAKAGEEHSFSDLLFERQTEGELTMQSLSGSWGRISVLAPVVNPEDLWKLSAEELAALTQEMRRGGICDRILLDLSSDLDPVPVLSACDRIILLRRQGAVMEKQMEEMKLYLKKKLEKGDWMELVLPEFPSLTEHFPGDEGSMCRELAEWIWTQYSEKG